MTEQAPTNPRISFALAFHNHQPVGNFGWVFEDVYRAAYRPMVDLLTRHPTIRCGLHYTGPLLQWLDREHPDFLDDVRALVDRGQVEILGGGLYEPVLASLPERDRVGQLRQMAQDVARRFGTRPRGAWLAERVWEPSLPAALADAGYQWTIVDDVHLRAAAIPDAEHWGTYTTDDQGRRLTIFPTEQGLRYLIPFQPVADVIEHLRTHATPDGTHLGTMGDDGEKFGAWPTTHEHCWGRGNWMEEFFGALEASTSWLTTVRPSDWTDAHPPVGRVYIPTSSYVEMTEWALPPADALEFQHVLAAASAEGRPEAKFLRGGFWRNFQRRYREVNDLHKQMLRASERVDAMPPGPARDRATDHLYRGQSNDCYWHGLFGGIYITHMRVASFGHLIAAEDLALAGSSADTGTTSRLVDLDIDGVDEVLFEGPGQIVAVKLDAGAAIAEWDARATRHPLAAVMRRRPEASHERLRAAVESGRLRVVDGTADAPPSADTSSGDPGGGAVESIHELVQSRESGLETRLVYDVYERRSALVHLWDAGVSADDVAMSRAPDRAAIVDAPYRLVERTGTRLVAERAATADAPQGGQPISVRKTFTLGGDRGAPTLTLGVLLENRSGRPLEGRFGLEWNLMFLGGGHNPAAFYEAGGERTPHDGAGTIEGAARIGSGNTDVGCLLVTEVAPPATAWWFPIETISNSESGFERVYQGSSLVLSWPVRLAAGERLEAEVRHAIETTRDGGAEEAAIRAASSSGG